jgi:hypothetical protein
VKIPWSETLSEWVACAGLGLIPLFCALAIGVLTDNEKSHNYLLSAGFIYTELILFCIVTNAASVVVFISKFNLLQTVAPGGRKLPTALIFFVILMALACAFTYVTTLVKHLPALLPMLSCMITTLIFSVWAERRIGIIARE